MVECWSTHQVKELLRNKHFVVIGDSIQRGLYKDLIRILQTDEYIQPKDLKAKGEKSCLGDTLLEGGFLTGLHNGKSYREVRRYQTDYHLVTFYMVTCCYSDYVETVLEDLMNEPLPDIVTMASCLWDLTRYGPAGRTNYQKNMQRLARRLQQALSRDTLFIWNTATPVKNARGGFMKAGLNFYNETLPLDVLEANVYAKEVMVDHGFDVLDMHFNFRGMINMRQRDGVHWNHIAHRRMTNLLLDHVAHVLAFPVPFRPVWATNINGNVVPNANRHHQRSYSANIDTRWSNLHHHQQRIAYEQEELLPAKQRREQQQQQQQQRAQQRRAQQQQQKQQHAQQQREQQQQQQQQQQQHARQQQQQRAQHQKQQWQQQQQQQQVVHPWSHDIPVADFQRCNFGIPPWFGDNPESAEIGYDSNHCNDPNEWNDYWDDSIQWNEFYLWTDSWNEEVPWDPNYMLYDWCPPAANDPGNYKMHMPLTNCQRYMPY